MAISKSGSRLLSWRCVLDWVLMGKLMGGVGLMVLKRVAAKP